MKIGMDYNELENTSYSTTGLTPTNCTIDDGGYCKIGKLVVVNLRLITTSSISANGVLISGLPKPSGTKTVTSAYGFTGNFGYIDAYALKTSSSISSGQTVLLSAVYIAE